MCSSGSEFLVSAKLLSEDNIQDCVEELRNLILGDNKLRRFRNDDSYLLRFLHCTDFNVPLAFRRIQDYNNLFLEHPEWFASTSPADKRKRIESTKRTMLPGRDKCGRRIYLFLVGTVDVIASSPQEETQIDEMFFESVLEDQMTQASGITLLVDMKHYSWKLISWLSPANLKIASKKADLYCCKEFVYHVVNTSFLVDATVKLVWPFLSENVKDKVKFHSSNWNSLHKYISPEVLPPEYGGTAQEVDFDILNAPLFEQSDEISERLRHQRTVEKK